MADFNIFQSILRQVMDGGTLSAEQSERAFQVIMNGGTTPAQTAALLVAMKMRGETIDEIVGAANVLRAKAGVIQTPAGTMDTCGTGGDGRSSYNISTAVAFVVAACGVPVAKHGNRAVSSKSGSADVLAELGLKLDADKTIIEKSIAEIGFCFVMAPQYHSAMRHVAPVRQELGTRTIFNLLGPLINPAHPEYQLLGVYSKKLLLPMAQVLQRLSVKRAWVVCSEDGLDELSASSSTNVVSLNNGEIKEFTVSPEDAGIERVDINELKGGDAEHNAKALRELLLGARGAYRNAVLLNAAAALLIAGKAADLKSGAAIAAEAIDSGNAYKMLQLAIEFSHRRDVA